MNIRRKIKEDSGFSLIESAIVLIIVGIIMSGAVNMFKTYHRYRCDAKTAENREIILRAIGGHLASAGYLPAPCDISECEEEEFGTDGWRRDTEIGIVPFKSLGIPESAAKDGYGNFFTYVAENYLVGEDDRHWARYCDYGYTADRARIEAFDGKGKSVLDTENKKDTVACVRTNIIAFVLISHGESGLGAFSRTKSPFKINPKDYTRYGTEQEIEKEISESKNIKALQRAKETTYGYDHEIIKFFVEERKGKAVQLTVWWYSRYGFASTYAGVKCPKDMSLSPYAKHLQY